MIRKNWFYITLMIIFLLYLGKDSLIKMTDNRKIIEQKICENKNKELEKNYQDLLKIMQLSDKNYNVTYSKIIIREIGEFYNKVTINKGTNDGLKKGDIVIEETGVIGIIKSTKENSSEVALITNKDTNMSVKVNDSYGILNAKDNQLVVKNIKIEGEIKEGDEVVTSGLTNIPAGLKIGTVAKVEKDHLELEYILNLEHSSFQKIKYVGVISV